MKKTLFVVLAVLAAASTLAAQDTLRVRSYQVVNVCSDERRWLLAVDLGRVLPSDSLVSFDITIGYDRTKLRPTDVLKEGTLSAGMSYAPFLNTVVPNEMRIAGGNIIKTVSGSDPLVAITGDFLGSCKEVDSLGYPWPATFNSEFKKRFTVVRLDSVRAEAVAKANPDVGARFESKNATISSTENFLEIRVLGSKLQSDSTLYRFTFTTSNKNVSLISDRGVKGLLNVSSVTRENVLEVKGSVVDKQPEFLIRYELTNASRPDSTVIVVKTEEMFACGCSNPALRDTVVVKINPTVSVASSDEHIEIIRMQTDAFTIQCDHEEMKTVQVYTNVGLLVYSAVFSGTAVTVPTSNLATGSYIVRTTCGKQQHVNLILK